jgi:nitrite reductase/ring-hydroxylating ferredoxin subunit
MMAGFVKVAQSDEIAPGQGKMIEVGGKKIALFNVEGSFYAIDDT